MVLLWLAGTLGATTAVFATVATVSNDLFNAGDPRNAKGEIRRAPPGFITTTSAAETVPTTTVPATEAPTTQPETTTTTAGPPETTAPSITVPEPVETAAPRVGTTVRTTVPAPTPATTVPIVTSPPTTDAPVVTEPPTTSPPVTTAPVSCDKPTPKAVGRNVIYYRSCTDGLRYSSAVPQAGWTAVALDRGPPSVTVRFDNGSTNVTCTLTQNDERNVSSSGDC